MEQYIFYDDVEYTWSDEMDKHGDDVDYFPHLSGFSYKDYEIIDEDNEEDNYTEDDNEYDNTEEDSDEEVIVGKRVEYIPEHIVFQKSVVVKPKPPPKIIEPEYLKSYEWEIPEIKSVDFPITHVELTNEIPKIEYKQKYSRVCKYLLQCKKWNCEFAHTIDEFEPVKCKFNKKCTRAYCKFIHPAKNETIPQYLKKMNITF